MTNTTDPMNVEDFGNVVTVSSALTDQEIAQFFHGESNGSLITKEEALANALLFSLSDVLLDTLKDVTFLSAPLMTDPLSRVVIERARELIGRLS